MNSIFEAYSWTNLTFIGMGLLMTLSIAFVVITISFIIGGLLAIFRYSKTPVIGHLSFLYVEIVRNSPLILILFLTFFGLPKLGIDVNLFWKMAIALIIFEISQLSEIVRGGLNSVDKGQIEAARSQGVSYIQMLFFIILPQAFKNMLPSIVNQFITIVKDTSYAAMFGLMEVLNSATILWNQDFGYIFPIMFLVATIYFVVNFSLSTFSIKLERKLS